jgi:pyruvate/2-oxoglutarate dehydrogenase complex dihydrolipoamide dehydrogenase (E3) component
MDGYDVIVIGTGTAAQVVLSRVRRAGLSVAVIPSVAFTNRRRRPLRSRSA